MFAVQTSEETLKILQSSLKGLSQKEAEKRLTDHGPNELPEKKRSLFMLFARQFNSIFVYILIVALVLSAAEPFLHGRLHPKEFVESGAILLILLLNAVLGFIQEYKADEAIALLKKLSSPNARVKRNGTECIIPSRELVPGDVVVVEAGDRISADGRILTADDLEADESSLTGESLPVGKTVKTIAGDPPLPEQKNMLFAGTVVTRGIASYVVTATAMHMELGKIATLVSQTEMPQTPLQHKLSRLSLALGGIVIALAGLVMALQWSRDLPATAVMLMGVSLAVSAVPEGLPAVVTACLAIGVRRMTKRRVLVRRLEALETLGSVTIICTDKTGTITENRMNVTSVWVPSGEPANATLLGQIAASCNHASLPNIGDPTEVGLLRFAKAKKIERLPIDKDVVPFSSEKKYMITKHRDREFLKGAPESIVNLLSDKKDESMILQETKSLAKKGLRVLACAVTENGTTRFAGLLGLEDPARDGVADAVRTAKKAGIRTIMITGDNADTAQAIAQSVGIHGDVITGKELMDMDIEELRERVGAAGVFARVSPEHKLMILDALQKNGEIVAMSGDGVNDAPALKGAHVGIAMGKDGTDVARDAASIVLTDDHFATIVEAIEEGRHIYDNIRKFILLLLQMNFYELLFFLSATLLDLPLPYLPLHILWINLMTDGLPALSLAMERTEIDIMNRPPRPPKENVFSGQWERVILATVLPLCMVLWIFIKNLHDGWPLEEVRTLVFTFAVCFELLFIFTMRSTRPLYEIGFFSNRWLVAAIAVPFILQIIMLNTPAISNAVGLTQLRMDQWLLLLLCASSGLMLFEGIKIVRLILRGELFLYRKQNVQ